MIHLQKICTKGYAMDNVSSKFFVIGVGILVTLTIVSGVILGLAKMGEIFGLVENTNTSIISQFDSLYAMYNGTETNVIGLINTLRRYEQDESVVIVETNYTPLDDSGIAIEIADRRTEEYKAKRIAKIEEERENGNSDFQYESKRKITVIEEGTYTVLKFEK